MRTLVIGGTGFIGYHIVQQLLAHGDSAAVLCRHTDAVATLFGSAVDALQCDIAQWRSDDYCRVLPGFDAVVFAAGVDERSQVQGDAHDFFQRGNVIPCEQLFTAVAQCGVPRAALLNSVFAWLHEQQPQQQLAQRHPYIRSRVEQHLAARAALAGSNTVLSTVYVPWIFGACAQRLSQWAGLVNYVRAAAPLCCIHGSVNMMSVRTLAAAVCGALHHARSSSAMPVGDENLSYVQLMQRLCALVQRRDEHVRLLSDSFFRDLTAVGDFFGHVFGMQSGIELDGMADLLLQDIVFDPAMSQQAWHYRGGDLDEALAAMVASLPEGTLLRGWRETLNWFSRA